MFKDIVKKFFAVGLVFALCVPCCFASAKPYDEDVIFEAIRCEVERCVKEHNLVFTENDEAVEPSQMNNRQLDKFYCQLVRAGIARKVEELDYPEGLDQYLYGQNQTIRETIYDEVSSCLNETKIRPRYNDQFLELDQMNDEQLMWLYNWLLDQGKVRDFGLLIR